MKHVEAESFWADWARLSPRERALFIVAAQEMNNAFARRGIDPLPHWPARLRIRPLTGHRSILEMTWSFADPDGRATFELVQIEGEPAIKWRRVGGHDIFKSP